MTSQIEDDDLFDEDEENRPGKKIKKKAPSKYTQLEEDDSLDDPFQENLPLKSRKRPIDIVPLGARNRRSQTPEDQEDQSIRSAIASFTQRLAIERSFHDFDDDGQKIDSRNSFEEFLLNCGCELHRHDDEHYYFLVNEANHAELVKKFESSLANEQKRSRIVKMMEEAFDDEKIFSTLLSPIHTAFGLQDTVIRALLLSPSVQTQVFARLIGAIDRLSGSDAKRDETLGLGIVAQLRYLDFVVDPKEMAKIIIEQDLSKWKSTVRDVFLPALPEVVSDPICQEELALHLRDLLLERSFNDRSFRQAALLSLLLLRTSPSISEEISSSLISNMKCFDISSVSLIVELALKNAEFNKNGLLRMLNRLKENLRVEDLKVAKDEPNKTSLDEKISELFMRFPKFMRLAGVNGWKQVITFFKGQKNQQSNDDEIPLANAEVSGMDEAIDSDNQNENSNAFTLFEVLFTISLLSHEACPPVIEQTMKQQASDSEKSGPFKEALLRAFQYKKFIAKNNEGLLRLARRFLWLNEDSVRSIGGLIYIGLIQALAEKKAKVVLKSLLSHLEGPAAEAKTCLCSLELLVESSFHSVTPHFNELKECLDHLAILSIENCHRLFRLLVSIQHRDPEEQSLRNEVCESIDRFSKSTDIRLKLWAVLGLVTQFEATFTSRAANRESSITNILKTMENVWGNDAHLRSTCYRFMAQVLKENKKSAISKSLISWSEKMIANFQSKHFRTGEENYVAKSELEEEEFRSKSLTWIVVDLEEWPAFVSAIELIQEISQSCERWAQRDSTNGISINSEVLRLVCEANVSTSEAIDIAGMEEAGIKKAINELFFIIHALLAILNNFGSMACDEKQLDALHKKYALLDVCRRLLSSYVSKVSEWEIPKAPFDQEKILVTEKKTTKRPKKSGKKSGKRQRSEEPEEDRVPSAFDDVDDENVEDENENRETIQARQDLLQMHYTIISPNKLPTLFPSLKLSIIIKLLQVESLSIQLKDNLLSLLADIVKDVLPKRKRKINPFNNSSRDALNQTYHGETAQVWKLLMKTTPMIIKTMAEMKTIFQQERDESGITDRQPKLFTRRVSVLLASLQILEGLLEFKDVQLNVGEKREQLLRIIEKASAEYFEIQLGSSQNSGMVACKLVIQICEICPTLEIAVVLSQLAFTLLKECTDEQRKDFALHLLSFLRCEWTGADLKPLRGPQLSGPASIIFQKYIHIRERMDRLVALEWFTLVKIAQVTSRHADRQVVTSIEDPLIKQQDNNTPFGCISKSTFTGVYRAALCSLNECINDNWTKANAISSRICSPTECINRWSQAAGIFAALAAMLEHKSLRTTAMLVAFAREGRKFVINFVKDSSFFVVFEKHTSQISEKAHHTLKAMQIGTRHLQQISLYAKQHKSPILLRTLPELRACAETFLRTVRSIMVKIGCADTVVFGLLVARDIDGEKVVLEEPEDESETPSPEETNNEEDETNDEGSRVSDVY